MAKSVIQERKECYFCGKLTNLERHHVFGGVANRPISEKYGLTVWLCHNCHTGKDGAQYDKMKNLRLKQDAQFAFERNHARSEWMKLIGKNYL
jgi:ribosomal protein L37AE/L43A